MRLCVRVPLHQRKYFSCLLVCAFCVRVRLRREGREGTRV
jgi:hypothetical protein